MRTSRIFMRLMALAVLMASCGSATPSATLPPATLPARASEPFWSAEGGFRVTSPVALPEAVELVEADFGSLEVHRFQGDSDGVSYSITYADYPERFVGLDPDSFLTTLRNEQVAATGGVLVAEDRVEASGVGGREIWIRAVSDQGSRVIFRSRLYWLPTRLYQVSVVAPDGREDEAAVVAYLESFLLTDRAY